MKGIPRYVVSLPLALMSGVFLYACCAQARITKAEALFNNLRQNARILKLKTSLEELEPLLPPDQDNAIIPLRKALQQVETPYGKTNWESDLPVPPEIWDPIIAGIQEAVKRPSAYEPLSVSRLGQTPLHRIFYLIQRKAVDEARRNPEAASELIALGDRLARILVTSLSCRVAIQGIRGHEFMLASYFAANWQASPRRVGSYTSLIAPLRSRPSLTEVAQVEPAIMCDLIDRAAKSPEEAAKGSDPRVAKYLRDPALVLTAKSLVMIQYSSLMEVEDISQINFVETRSRRFVDDIWGNFVWECIRPAFTCAETATLKWNPSYPADLTTWFLKAAHSGQGPVGIESAKDQSGAPIGFALKNRGYEIASKGPDGKDRSISLMRLSNGIWLVAARD